MAEDERFASNSERVANRAELHAEIEGVFSRLTEEQTIERLEGAGIANARIRTVGQFLGHPQLEARDRWREVGSPVGPVRTLVPPATLAGTEPAMKPIPGIGEHTEEILSALGHRPEDSTDGDGDLGEVRKSIDAVDREIVRLLAEREGHVRQAARLKETRKDVEAPDRVEEVVRNARTLADEHGASPEVAEGVYRAMISRFVSLEMDEHTQNEPNKEEDLRQ